MCIEGEWSLCALWTALSLLMWNHPHLLQWSHSVANTRSLWIQWAAPPCAFLRRAQSLTRVCDALWVACLMCDRCVTGMCLGQVTGEIPLGNCKRLDHSLSHAVFFCLLFHPSLNLVLELFPVPPSFDPFFFSSHSLSENLSNFVLKPFNIYFQHTLYFFIKQLIHHGCPTYVFCAHIYNIF